VATSSFTTLARWSATTRAKRSPTASTPAMPTSSLSTCASGPTSTMSTTTATCRCTSTSSTSIASSTLARSSRPSLIGATFASQSAACNQPTSQGTIEMKQALKLTGVTLYAILALTFVASAIYVRPVDAEDDCMPGTYSVNRLPLIGLVCIGE